MYTKGDLDRKRPFMFATGKICKIPNARDVNTVTLTELR